MTNVKTLSKVIAIALLAAGSTQAMAVETVVSTATVTVKNTFTFEEVKPIAFGTIQVVGDLVTAIADGPDAASMTINPDVNGVTDNPVQGTKGIAKLTVLEPGTPGKYTVAGVGQYTQLTVTLPSNGDVNLTPAGPDNVNQSVFAITDFKAISTTGTSSAEVGGANKLVADVDGAASFAVGATLSTDARGSAIVTAGYTDALYSGNYTITVSY